MFNSFTIRIFASVLVAALLSIGCTVYYGLRAMEEGQELDVRERMISEASLASELCRLNGGDAAKVAAWLAASGHRDLRLTIVDKKGDVTFDSTRPKDGGQLDNHADRPEIIQAAKEGTGFSMRDSGTLSETLVYAAVSMDQGAILRLAVPMSEVRHVLWNRSEMLLRTGVLAALLSALFAVLVSLSLKKSFQPMIQVVKDIASGHLERRISSYPGREFAPLAEAVNSMAHSIEEQVKTQADQTAQLETILNTMSDGVLVLGQKGHIRRCNRAMERSFPAISSARGRQVVEVVPFPALQNAVLEMLKQKDAGSAPVGRHTVSLHMGLQNGRIFSAILSRPQRPEPRVGLVIVFHDITEIMRLERVRRDFVANVSHELRTPLTAITGYAETIMELDSIEQSRKFAAIILRNARGLEHMTRDLLELTRLERTDTTVDLTPVSPSECCAEAAGLCKDAFDRRQMDVATDVKEDCLVLADASLLVQVFRNLLENASRYAAEKSTVHVTCSNNAGQTVLRVHNEGSVIPQQDLERIFERFYSVEKHRGQGTGLGLAICRHILDRMHGSIWAESPDAENGTSFVFTLQSAALADTGCGDSGAASQESGRDAV